MRREFNLSILLIGSILFALTPSVTHGQTQGKTKIADERDSESDDDARSEEKVVNKGATDKSSSTENEKDDAVKSPKSSSKIASNKKEDPASQPADDPFIHLSVVIPRQKLPPLNSVRIRDKREAEDRSRKGNITVTIGSSPKGANIYYGRKLLGATPLSLSAQRGSTPFDLVLRKKGYMTLHTRIMRKVSHSYFFKLSPAKLR